MRKQKKNQAGPCLGTVPSTRISCAAARFGSAHTRRCPLSEMTIDAIARRAANSTSRRASLLALGGAGLAATAARPSVTSAAKAGKKCKKKAKKKCKRDIAACRATLEEHCANIGNPAGCLLAQACCDSCSANGYVTCTLAIQA